MQHNEVFKAIIVSQMIHHVIWWVGLTGWDDVISTMTSNDVVSPTLLWVKPWIKLETGDFIKIFLCCFYTARVIIPNHCQRHSGPYSGSPTQYWSVGQLIWQTLLFELSFFNTSSVRIPDTMSSPTLFNQTFVHQVATLALVANLAKRLQILPPFLAEILTYIWIDRLEQVYLGMIKFGSTRNNILWFHLVLPTICQGNSSSN